MRNPIKSACAAVAAVVLSTTQIRAAPLTPFQLWQVNYFGSINSPGAAAAADPDVDGQNNLTEFIAGFDPTNSASLWVIHASPTNGLAPLTVSFSDDITVSEVTNRLWDFGDSGTSSGATPEHTYANVGVFSVSETVFNMAGHDGHADPNRIDCSDS